MNPSNERWRGISQEGEILVWLSAAFTFVVAALASATLTGFVRRGALSRGMLDIPNQRSSHLTATPRGGGAAIVIVTLGALLVFTVQGYADTRFVIAVA